MKKASEKKISKKDSASIVNFLYEVGTMRKLMRIHRQTLLTDDLSDSIASHSYRVTLISWFLAKAEGADPYKTVMMALLHDVGEARSNDHNWLHKRYVKVFEEEVTSEQLGDLPFPDLKEFVDEYSARKSLEALLAKDADLLDQLLLLREYEWNGNREAGLWLWGEDKKGTSEHLKRIQSKTAQELGKLIFTVAPSDWWKSLWTAKNR